MELKIIVNPLESILAENSISFSYMKQRYHICLSLNLNKVFINEYNSHCSPDKLNIHHFVYDVSSQLSTV